MERRACISVNSMHVLVMLPIGIRDGREAFMFLHVGFLVKKGQQEEWFRNWCAMIQVIVQDAKNVKKKFLFVVFFFVLF